MQLCFTSAYISVHLFSSKSDLIHLNLRRGFSSHPLLCLCLLNMCVFFPSFSVGRLTLFPPTKTFLLLLLVCRCPFFTSISLVTHTQCLKIAKVVERDLRQMTTKCSMWPLFVRVYFLYLNCNKPSADKQENLKKDLVLIQQRIFVNYFRSNNGIVAE